MQRHGRHFAARISEALLKGSCALPGTPLMANCAAKKENDRMDASKMCDCRFCNFFQTSDLTRTALHSLR
jgi:hypothetical protein